jgi:hypothetical protein
MIDLSNILLGSSVVPPIAWLIIGGFWMALLVAALALAAANGGDSETVSWHD